MESRAFLTRQQLATRWQCGLRTVDRRRDTGALQWVDLGTPCKPLVRIPLAGVVEYENRMLRGRAVVPVGDVVNDLMQFPERLTAVAQADERRTTE